MIPLTASTQHFSETCAKLLRTHTHTRMQMHTNIWLRNRRGGLMKTSVRFGGGSREGKAAHVFSESMVCLLIQVDLTPLSMKQRSRNNVHIFHG